MAAGKMTREQMGKLTPEQKAEWFANRFVTGMNAAVKGNVKTS